MPKPVYRSPTPPVPSPPTTNGAPSAELAPYWTDNGGLVRLHHGDVLAVLKRLPTASVNTVVTSPPYWGLRDYQTDGQIGLEESPGEYVRKMVEVFREVRRVLRDDGTVWLNLGDSYCSSPPGHKTVDAMQGTDGLYKRKWNAMTGEDHSLKEQFRREHPIGPGNLVGIPWRVAFALQEDGWILRQDIIWYKPSPMPESVRNRCTKAHEYVFLLVKRSGYFCDMEAVKESSLGPDRKEDYEETKAAIRKAPNGSNGHASYHEQRAVPAYRNKRSVWTVASEPYPGAHFATFPPRLIEPCILAGCPEKVCAKCGAPWVRVVERERRPTRPGEDTKVKQPGVNSRVFQDRDPKHSSERKQREDYRDPSVSEAPLLPGSVIGNRDPQRHVTETVTKGWEPSCECFGKFVTEKGTRKVAITGLGEHEKKANTVNSREGSTLREPLGWEEKETSVRRYVSELPLEEHPTESGVVLDIFMGSGTTACVAVESGRRAVGIELSQSYLDNNAIPRIRGKMLSIPRLAGYVRKEPRRFDDGNMLE